MIVSEPSIEEYLKKCGKELEKYAEKLPENKENRKLSKNDKNTELEGKWL